MTCGCMNPSPNSRGLDDLAAKRPTEHCVYCGEKHISTAYALFRESGYEDINRQFIVGELVLAQWHLKHKYIEISLLLRDARHLIQERRESEVDWDTILSLIDKIVSQQLDADRSAKQEIEKNGQDIK